MTKKLLSAGVLCLCLLSNLATAQLLQNFDGATFPPAGWLVFDNAIGTTYSWQSTTTAQSGGKAAYIRYENVTSGLAEDWLVSPQFTVPTGAILKFYHRQQFASAFGSVYTIRVSTTLQNDPTVFTTVQTYAESAFTTTYSQASVDLSAYAGQSIYLAFVMTNDDGDSWYIDEVSVAAPPTCLAPTALSAFGITPNSASIRWTGGGASNWNIEYGPTGFARGTGTLVNATNDTLLLSGLTAATTYQFYVRDSCGVGNSSTWAGPVSFVTPCVALTLPFTETWETTSSSIGCWTAQTNWAISSAASAYSTGSRSIIFPFFSVSTGSFDAFSPAFAPVPAGYRLSFDHAYATYVTEKDSLKIYYSVDGGATYTLLAGLEGGVGGALVTAAPTSNSFVPTASQWSVYNTALPVGTNKIKFTAKTAYGNNLYLDNITVEAVPACGSSTALGATSVTTTGASLYWTGGGASNWNVQYGPAGFALGAGTLIAATNDTIAVSGLSSNTVYSFYVQDSCGVGNVSAWQGPYSFSTLCSALTLPFAEDWEASSSNINCWSADPEWLLSTTVSAYGVGSRSIYFSFYNVQTGSYDAVSPEFSPAPAGYELSFDHAYATYATEEDSLKIYYSIDGGATYALLAGLDGGTSGALVTAAPTTSQFVPTSSQWANYSIALPAGTNRLKFTAVTEYGNDLYLDNMSINMAAVSSGCITSSIINDTLCIPGNATFEGAPGNYVVTINSANVINQAAKQYTFYTDSDTTLTLYEAGATGNGGHVGPLSSIAALGFGNFTNGQYITVMDTISIDSMTVRSSGSVTAQVVFSNAANTAVIQRGQIFTTGTAIGDYKIAVGAVLTPGVYFMNVSFLSGTGTLFRTTSGAVYPYTLPGLMSIDSTNFATQNRIYYTFDLIVKEVCLSAPVTVGAYIVGQNAGTDQSLALCSAAGTVDLNSYVSAEASVGGTFLPTAAGGALTGSMFNPAVSGAGNFTVKYVVAAVGTCPSDTATLSILVENCLSCSSVVEPVLMADTICGPGTVSISGTTTSTDIIWYDANGDFLTYGLGFTQNISATTEYKAQSILSSGPSIHVGPTVNMSNNVYPTGNFTNGQYITVHQDVRVDSATFAVNGPLTFAVIIQSANKQDTLQFSKLINFAGADTAQKEVGVYLKPGVYFIGTIPVSGTGVLWRPTGGGNFPYGVNNLFTVDSSDFGPTRYYYLYDMVVSGACASPMDSVSAGVLTAPMAGADNGTSVCGNITSVDLATLLSGADAGGTWLDNGATGALTGSVFSLATIAPGTYTFTYIVNNAACADSAVITVTVNQLPNAGSDASVALCSDASAINLTTLLSGADAGGTFSAVTGGAGLSGTMFNAGAAGAGTYTIRYIVQNSCSSDTSLISVTVSAAVNAGADAAVTVCDTLGVIDLSAYLSAGVTTGGTWLDASATGALTGSMFDAMAVADGNTYTFKYVVLGTGVCANDTASVNVTVSNCEIGLPEFSRGGLSVYPNPTFGKFTISNSGTNGNMILEVYNAAGMVVIQTQYQNFRETDVDISHLANGVYSIKVTTESGVYIKRIVKK